MSSEGNLSQSLVKSFSNIIIAIILSMTLLILSGVFDEPKKPFATVNYHGGFKKIGVIESEQVFSEAKVTKDGSILWQGDIPFIVSKLKESLDGVATPESSTLSLGVEINADTGVELVGSANEFELMIDSINLFSSKSSPIFTLKAIENLNKLESDLYENYQQYVSDSLTFTDINPVGFNDIARRIINQFKN